MVTEQLKIEVEKEAALLKVHATKEELGNLDFDNLDPFTTTLCIYGQMTGGCYTDRAHELIVKCARLYSNYITRLSMPTYGIETGQKRSFTDIEYYICQKGAKNAELISYLKSETETFEA